MNIIFNRIEFENFLSYENGSYDFKNGIDLISGKNGSGKSSIGESLFFVLFGRPFRKIKLPSLINKIKSNKLKVILYFNIDNKQFKIIRGIKPNIFEIYEFKDSEYKLIKEQASIRDYQSFLEQEIIKINETIFRQLISLSANLPTSKPFMDLNSKEKEELFQTITDTTIFTDIKLVITKRLKDKKQIFKDHEYKRSILENSIKSDRLAIEQIEKRNKDFLVHHADNIKITNDNILNSIENIDKYTVALEKIKKLKEEFEAANIELVEFKNAKQVMSLNINKNKHDIQHIESAEAGAITCKYCSKLNYLLDVDISRKDKLINDANQLSEKYNSISDELMKIQERADKIKEKLLNGKRIKDNLEEQKNNIKYYEGKLVELNNITPVIIDYSLIEEKEEDLDVLLKNMSIISKNIEELSTLDNIIGNNNIKSNILKSQVSLLNSGINYFLELFSLLEYNFVIDENFQERIISRDVDSEFQSLSNGQKARVSFSIMFAFLKLIEEKNSTRTNILILDEILDSSVDSQGREELLNIINIEFSSTKNVIIISHDEEIKEKIELFDRIINVSKDKFSKIEVEELK